MKSIAGRRLGLASTGNLVANGTNISQPCADASITVAAPSGDDRAITIQLKDINGVDIAYVETVKLVLFTTAARTAFAVTGGSTGLVAGTDGALLAVVAKKVFLATSEADGDLDLTFTDTANEACFLALYLPNGRVITADITLS